MKNSASIWRKLLFIPPIAIAVVFFVWQSETRQAPRLADRPEPVKVVRTVTAERLSVTPVAVGYGSVQPAQVWSAVAQVSGRVIEKHENLSNGSILPAGTVLLKLDPVDYQLELARIEASIDEIDVQAENTRSSLAIETRNLELAERESSRLQSLRERGTASQSDADNAERAALNARTQVQNFKNTLALLPVQRRVLEAQRDQARRNIENTTIRAPFNMRVASLSVETGQFVSIGQTLFEGDSVDRVEVVAQISVNSLGNLLRDRSVPAAGDVPTPKQVRALTNFSPMLEMDLGGQTARWQARFVRISDSIDPQTRTLGLVAAVDDPFGKMIPGQKPPLTKGMFVKVVVRGNAYADRVVVPLDALRNGQVMVVDIEERLSHRMVEVEFEQEGISVIRAGLEGGERVVISDVIPKVEGMLLKAEADTSRQTQMRKDAGQ